MGIIASFDYSKWRVIFPEFQEIPKEAVDQYAVMAGVFIGNDGSSVVNVLDTQTVLLNIVTAHICQLNAIPRGAPAKTGSPQLVGAINSATEGSVSVSVTNSYPEGTVQWWQQTKYGAQYWAMTVAYRTMRYRPGYPRPVDPVSFPGYPYQWPR